MKKISVVIPVRFSNKYPRSENRMKLCLESLRAQTLKPELMEIIISDFGSENQFIPLLQKSCQQFNAKFIHVSTKEIWNRSRASNIAIRNSNPESQYILSSDIDIIFKDTCLERILDSINLNRIVACETRDLPETLALENLSVKIDFLKLKTIPRSLGWGTCCFPRNWIFKIRGYDEEFKGWGGEDDDLMKRARLGGMLIVRLYNLVFHQWHKSLFDVKEIIPFREANRKRLKEVNTLIRNENREWGKFRNNEE